MKKNSFLFIFLCLFILSGCKENQKTITLINNQGISISDGEKNTLPIQSLKSIDNSSIVNTEYKKLDSLIQNDVLKLYKDSNIATNLFSLENPMILFNKNYEKPVIIQLVFATKNSCTYWDYVWEEDQEVTFGLDGHLSDDNETVVWVNILRVNSQNIITECETYLFSLQNSEEEK